MSKQSRSGKKSGNNVDSVENRYNTPKRVKKDFYDKKSFKKDKSNE